MRLGYVAVLALLALSTGCPPAKPPTTPTASVNDADLPKDGPGLIKYADSEYTKATAQAVQNAAKALQKALELDKNSYEALWRLARVYAWLGDEYDDDTRREEFAQKGIDTSKQAMGVAGAENRVEGNYYLATTTGQFAYVKKVKAKDLVPVVLEAAKKAVAADEKFDHAGPLRLLGSLYAQAPEPPTSVGDHEEGIKLLSKAVRLDSNYPQNHLLLGDAYRIDDKLDLAEIEYNKVLAARPSGEWASRLPKWQKQAEDGLKRVANLRRQRQAGERGAAPF